ncbi:hypothetical protein K466DRAFT_579374 [Polyporus arcularius HHB13444]|uniref:CxC5 like cysteine cluster associated with KDZ domain-containing protein n=1 Tax=Polyporus arcularius HHB13444 TaxID=1314778 RepID=A0A5C3NL26_9APHY|nr:hypothetical protein K466DRAFT_579374 [Polyporus arcularius HHB13444]
MSTLELLFESLKNTPGLLGISLSTVNNFIRLAAILKTAILLRQVRTWNAAVAPAILPPHILSFIAGRLSLSETTVRALWDSLNQEIWSREGAVLDDGMVPPSTLDALSSKFWLCERMLFPTTQVCTNSQCINPEGLLRWKEEPKKVVLFTMADVSSVFCAILWLANPCLECKTYYGCVPAFIQVSDHSYVEHHVLEHFAMLSVLSWTSATNAAHIYHESLSKLKRSQHNEPRFRLRTEHVWDGFVALALLRDAKLHATILQKNWYTDAMRLRNERIRRSGQPEYAHWCTKCHRRFDQPDGTTKYVDCLITDGISIGRPCCGVAHCTGELRTPRDHWCDAHQEQARWCVIAIFTLRTRLQRAQVSHPTDAVSPDAPIDNDIEVKILDNGATVECPEKPETGIRTARGKFGRNFTHNEQLLVRPCGMIQGRETFFGSETVPQVVDMLKKKHLMPGSMPRIVCYDNNCGLYKWCAAHAYEGEALHLKVGLPVDVFHWTCKHKKSDIECSVHCNPHMFPDIIGPDGKTWYFNTSAAEQTNVWFGGYHAIVHEMSADKYDFFLDEMILCKNKLTRAKLEDEGCFPGYNEDLQFAMTDVSS